MDINFQGKIRWFGPNLTDFPNPGIVPVASWFHIESAWEHEKTTLPRIDAGTTTTTTTTTTTAWLWRQQDMYGPSTRCFCKLELYDKTLGWNHSYCTVFDWQSKDQNMQRREEATFSKPCARALAFTWSIFPLFFASIFTNLYRHPVFPVSAMNSSRASDTSALREGIPHQMWRHDLQVAAYFLEKIYHIYNSTVYMMYINIIYVLYQYISLL